MEKSLPLSLTQANLLSRKLETYNAAKAAVAECLLLITSGHGYDECMFAELRGLELIINVAEPADAKVD